MPENPKREHVRPIEFTRDWLNGAYVKLLSWAGKMGFGKLKWAK
jgi:hypothetical protein